MSTTTVKAAGACTTRLCHQIGIQFGPYSIWLLILALVVIGVAAVLATSAARRRHRERQIQREALATAAGYPPDAARLWRP